MSTTNDTFAHLGASAAAEDQPRKRAKQKRSSVGDYEVGYGRPPKATRFQKGQSGNRRGRPKKAASSAEFNPQQIVHDVMTMPMTLTINGRMVEVQAFKALLTKWMGKALDGDPKAFDQLSKLLQQLGRLSPNCTAPADQQTGVLLVRQPIEDPVKWQEQYGNLAEFQARKRQEWEEKRGPVSKKASEDSG